jgi:phosphate uptake regulator
MKRKVIKQRDSYTVTLPIKWAKRHGIGKDTELDIMEDKRALVIKTEAMPEKREATLVLHTKDYRFIEYTLNNYYRSGYDRLILKGRIKEKDIYAALELLSGFDITDIKKDSITIEAMAEASPAKLDTLMKQLFFIAKQDLIYVTESISRLKRIDTEKIYLNSRRAIKNSNFCLRSVSKKRGHFNTFQWTMINLVTWIERQIYYLVKAIDKKKMERFTKAELDYFKSIVHSLSNLYTGIYEKKLESFNTIHINYVRYEDKRFDLMKKQSHYKSIVLYYFSMINRYILQSTSSGIGITSMGE